jgi:hypothetical protein
MAISFAQAYTVPRTIPFGRNPVWSAGDNAGREQQQPPRRGAAGPDGGKQATRRDALLGMLADQTKSWTPIANWVVERLVHLGGPARQSTISVAGAPGRVPPIGELLAAVRRTSTPDVWLRAPPFGGSTLAWGAAHVSLRERGFEPQAAPEAEQRLRDGPWKTTLLLWQMSRETRYLRVSEWVDGGGWTG